MTVTQEEVAAPAPEPTPEPAPEPELGEEETVALEATPESGASADLSAFDDYTVKELREELRRLDLPVSGSKSELKQRLAEAQGDGA